MKKFDHNKIKEFRSAADLTQDSLAAKMTTEGERVWVQQVSAWERGELIVKADTLAKLAGVLGKTTDDFFVDNDLI